jgi:hypothetical protein
MAFINSWMLASKKFSGFPPNYPVPASGQTLFYIQRNVNKNTIVYDLNFLEDGSLNRVKPLNVYWIMYENRGEKKNINFLQRKLAYGYNVTKNEGSELEIQLVSYKKRRIYITMNEEGEHKAYMLINGTTALLKNIFVYANESGAFPSVEYVEMFGVNEAEDKVVYEKISI